MAEVLTPTQQPAPPRTGRIEPTHYASVRGMAEWFAAARPGNEMVYATGASLDPREPARILASEWARRSSVVLFQQRGEDGRLKYFARRSPAPQPPVPGTPPSDPRWWESEEGLVYELLRECATHDDQCPSLQAVADRLELRDRHRAQYLIRQLVKGGLIRLEAAAKLGPRVVRIVATGKCTPENNDTLGVKR